MKIYIKHIAACFSSPISKRASNLNNWWQRVVRGGTSDYNTAICYSSLSRCSVLLLFSELVHQSWNRILHFINPAEGSFQPHHSAPLMSDDSLIYSFKPSNPLDKICKGGIYKRSTEENWLLSRTCLRCVCTVLRRTNYLYFRNIYFVLFTRPLAIVGHPGHSIMRIQVITMMIVVIYILWWSVCLSVCHEKSSLPPGSFL